MSSVSITIDVSKINKKKIVDRKYLNREGHEVVIKEYKVELVPLKEPKLIKNGGDWILKKTHFLAEQQTKEERAVKAKTVYVGEGFTFFDAKGEAESQDVGVDAEINDDDIPF